ncbi:MAG TPA: hypothetical protein DHW02_04835 [Ktedonobacter sp.]|nr:hypothetical protein [Ktedonobacter sp.]
MSDIPINEQECREDVLRRTHKWVTALEERIILLMNANDIDAMKPGECEQAISRHLALLLRMLQIRQQYAEAVPSAGEQALLDVLLHSMDEE